MHAYAKQHLVLDDVADAGKDVLIEQSIAGKHVCIGAKFPGSCSCVPELRHHIGAPVVHIIERAFDGANGTCVKIEFTFRELELQFCRAGLAGIDRITAEEQEMDPESETGKLDQEMFSPAAKGEHLRALDALEVERC